MFLLVGDKAGALGYLDVLNLKEKHPQRRKNASLKKSLFISQYINHIFAKIIFLFYIAAYYYQFTSCVIINKKMV